MKSWHIYLLIFFLSCLPLISMFLTPELPHTSDGAMHAIRFASYYKEFVGGQFPVRWTSQFHFGYGTTLFNFTYPLPYLVAIPFMAAGTSVVLLLKLSFALTYILAGLFMYLFASTYFKDRKTAFFVTIMYQFAPFRLVEMLVRGNLGTLYSYMLLPLVFYGIVRFTSKKTYSSFALLVASVALLALSHTIIGFAFIGISGIFVLVLSRKLKSLFSTYFAFLTGVGLSAFFIIPAILEQKYTNGYLFTKDVFYNHFPSIQSLILPNFTNSESLRVAEVSVQIGLFHLLAFIAVIYLLIRNKLKGKDRIFAVYLVFVTTCTILFIQSIAKPIWEYIALIRQFQYPWRFLSIITFTTAVSSAYFIRQFSFFRKTYVFITFTALVVLSTAYFWRPIQGFQHYEKSFYWDYPLTTNYFSEVNTIWMAKEPSEFPEKRIEVIGGEAEIQISHLNSTLHVFSVQANNQTTIVDRTFFFPGWKVLIDGIETQIQFQDTNYAGLITFQVEKGFHNVVVEFRQSRLQQLSNGISLIVLLSLIIGYPMSKMIKRFDHKIDTILQNQ